MKDDRYRLGQTAERISEALWIVMREYGITSRLEADEQAAVARTLAAGLRVRSGPMKRSDVERAFAKYDLSAPPRGFAGAVIARLERLDR